MESLIDRFLNKITMYRLVLYYLIVLVAVAIVLSAFDILPFTPFAVVFTTLFIVVISWITNTFFAKVLNATTNIESVYISALILALIVAPIKTFPDMVFVGWAATLTMASKYIFAIKNKHIFNPVAIAVALTSVGLMRSASWWVGTTWLMPFVVVGGYLIVRKIRRENMVFSFGITALLTIFAFTFLKQSNLLNVLNNVLQHSSYFFLAFVMLTEPLTTPPTQSLQIAYGAIVGFLFAPQIHIGTLYSTPELALLVGNTFAYLVGPKEKLILKLKEKIRISPDTYDFIFSLPRKLAFIPGQYMEWTLSHHSIDDRGNRRYFTLASSPSEDTIRIGVKFYEPSSSYKKTMLAMNPGSTIIASQRAGDFILPEPNAKYVFVAGGIGVTPFRSMLKYLLDTQKRRDIVVLYSNKNAEEIVYRDILTEAEKVLGIRTIYTITDATKVSPDWKGMVGRVNSAMIQQSIPDYRERIFYLSGPHAMVTGFETVLKSMGVKKLKIRTDYFPGFV